MPQQNSHPKPNPDSSPNSSSDLTSELIAGFILDDLNASELEQFSQLVASQPELETEIDQYAEVYANLAQIAIATPSSALRSRTLSQIHIPKSFAQKSPQKELLTKSIQKPWTTPILTCVSLVLAASLGFYSYLLRQELNLIEAQVIQRDAIAMLQESNTILTGLKGMDSAIAATGNLVTTPGHNQAVLVIRNLPALTPGQFYFVWAVVNGKKVACNKFEPNSEGVVLAKVAMPNAKIDSLVITVESSSQLNQPQGPMVMTSNV
jgi:hypothetical protein